MRPLSLLRPRRPGPRFRRRVTLLSLPLPLLLLAACGGASDPAEALRRLAQPQSAHERYAHSLREAGLANAALGRDWLAASERAVRAPLVVTLPYRETGYFNPGEANALGLRVQPRRGQRLLVRVEPAAGAAPFALFVDLFEVEADSGGAPARPRLVASADSGGRAIERDVDDDRVAYVVRLQPELLRGGRYTLTIEAQPSLVFPVAGRRMTAVQSYFGASRDAGRRRHEGVDIFAPRGTPVVAGADGYVTHTGVSGLGGKVVWLRASGRGRSLYYAHLDSQLVHPGQRVRRGDTLGLVGNTGNARTTAPHLHFGIYARGQGAIDPFPYIDTRRAEPPRLVADVDALGALRRVAARGGAPLGPPTAGPGGSGAARLPPATVLRVEAATGALYRVRLPDGTAGYVAAALTERADRGETLAASRVVAARGGAERSSARGGGRAGRSVGAAAEVVEGVALRERPSAAAAVVDSVAARTPLEVLGRYGDFVLVRTGERREGWVGGTR